MATVGKLLLKYRFETDYLCYVINIDEGCGIIDTSKVSNVAKKFYSIGEMTYSMLEENRQYLLGYNSNENIRSWK